MPKRLFKDYTIKDIAERTGLSVQGVRYRLARGWTVDDILACPEHRGNGKTMTIEHEGRQTTFRELAKETGLNVSTLQGRYARGKRDAELVKPLILRPVKEIDSIVEESGLSRRVVYTRYTRGWDRDRIMRTPAKNRRSVILVNYNGTRLTLQELADITGIKLSTLRARYANGKRGSELWGRS